MISAYGASHKQVHARFLMQGSKLMFALQKFVKQTK
jgi:hypothetical protein